ncbi:sulfate-transporting ATPase [Natrialba hulunbeirensis JCM 10989]|uniref:Sulfate-transporting ATPase n=1 Tax=Natrialba hulunbeirensis JCM 10989 TaxID=1227493 RepID=L9ZYZ4_9EURY|nr:ABC transporter ATP-binding protein [Natrialba hulunbeirensis]ELY91740.1 sulfate-transporting ATPase [Natrialba hulunbeirensis JCM 10989]
MRITITDVHKRYGDVVALDGPSFDIPSGSTFGVLGTNGAGKTTLFGLLVGHDTPDSGHIEVGGVDVEQAGHRVRERVAFLPEHAGFPPAMTGREVLSVHARIRGITAREQSIDEALETVGLTDAADRTVSGYSNGMGRRLGLASALLGEPPVLVLDEPTAGLDPRGVATFHQIIERIDRETNTTVVLSSHVLEEVERLCDSVAILEDGVLRAAGSVDELRTADGEHVTVTVRPSADQELTQLREAAHQYGDVTETDGELTVTCERGAAVEFCGGLESDAVDHFEVHEPGLEAAFHEALATGDAGTGSNSDTGTDTDTDSNPGTNTDTRSNSDTNTGSDETATVDTPEVST